MTETRAALDRRREERRQFRRAVSGKVIDAYRAIDSAIGQNPAFDYAKITGGQGAQYSSHGGGMFTAIDFTADVLTAVSATVTGHEREWYLGLLNSNRDHEDSTPDQDKIHVLIARTYIERGIYPIVGYFTA